MSSGDGVEDMYLILNGPVTDHGGFVIRENYVEVTVVEVTVAR